ncbi:hypothetical protein C1645_817899 [Glomus cerebriforme]|uniref:Uncharacterized protein n=1 Tax=Glomus cerebriforme TaxID=658196 RepID=A0A397TC49_9GLOM|nr:hypothetical protein C1645_817899 [Glomus cerebriforme]
MERINLKKFNERIIEKNNECDIPKNEMEINLKLLSSMMVIEQKGFMKINLEQKM